MEKTPSSTVRVRFQDCDPFNHLNNSKYLDYFINAREDHLINHYQLNVFSHMKQHRKAWVVGSNQIMYLKPAVVMEEVCIETKLIAYSEKMLTAEMHMWDTARTHIKAMLWVKFMYVDFQTNRATEHSQELMELFEEVLVPVVTTVFEDRCKLLLESVKTGAAL